VENSDIFLVSGVSFMLKHGLVGTNRDVFFQYKYFFLPRNQLFIGTRVASCYTSLVYSGSMGLPYLLDQNLWVIFVPASVNMAGSIRGRPQLIRRTRTSCLNGKILC